MYKAFRIGALALALMAPSVVNAAPFEGTVSYAGLWSTTTGNFLLDNELFFTNVVVIDAGGTFEAEGMEFLDLLDHVSPLSYNPVTTPVLLWTHAPSGIAFTLDSFVVTGITATTVDFQGLGTFSGAGYDETAANWALSAQRSGDVLEASFSADAITEDVPEPATLLLLSLGLLGAGLARRTAR